MSPRESSSSSSSLRFPAWQHEYEAVLSEPDAVAMFKRVEVAQAAMLTRRDNLRRTKNDLIEREAIDAGLATLLVIKKKWLKFA